MPEEPPKYTKGKIGWFFTKHNIIHPSVSSNVHPSSSSRKKKMMEREEDDDSWRRQQIIHMFCVENLAGERNGSISCKARPPRDIIYKTISSY
jgi:hypothetical protein